MRVYVGQTRSRALIAELRASGFGELTCRGELPPRRRPWVFDNGAYRDWKAGEPFDAPAFRADVARIIADALAPDFVVLPDRVAEGRESLRESVAWIAELRPVAPLYLAVQDGLEPTDLYPLPDGVAGLFVGGTLGWKIRTAERWVDYAHVLGVRCHIGRVGTPRRLRWAARIGADSVDSSLPLWRRKELAAFTNANMADAQRDLFAAETEEPAR